MRSRNHKAKSCPLPATTEAPAPTGKRAVFHLELCKRFANRCQPRPDTLREGLRLGFSWSLTSQGTSRHLKALTLSDLDIPLPGFYFQKETIRCPEQSCRPCPHTTVIPKSEKRVATLRTDNEDVAELRHTHNAHHSVVSKRRLCKVPPTAGAATTRCSAAETQRGLYVQLSLRPALGRGGSSQHTPLVTSSRHETTPLPAAGQSLVAEHQETRHLAGDPAGSPSGLPPLRAWASFISSGPALRWGLLGPCHRGPVPSRETLRQRVHSEHRCFGGRMWTRTALAHIFSKST